MGFKEKIMINHYEYIMEQIEEATNCILPQNHSSVFQIYYRGHCDIDWELVPTIARKDETTCSQIAITEQTEMERAKKEGRWNCKASLFENIATLQHYNYKTRFLDYTTDLDVALYFACKYDKDCVDKDGALCLCRYTNDRTASNLDSIMISELAYVSTTTRVMDLAKKLASDYEEFSSMKYDEIGMKILSWCNHGFMVTPSEQELIKMETANPRIVRQKGAFFVFGNITDPPSVAASTINARSTSILPQIAKIPVVIRPGIYRGGAINIRIPSAWKPEILCELAKRGITDNYLFPDKT